MTIINKLRSFNAFIFRFRLIVCYVDESGIVNIVIFIWSFFFPSFPSMCKLVIFWWTRYVEENYRRNVRHTKKSNRDTKHRMRIFWNNLFYNWCALCNAAVVWWPCNNACRFLDVTDSGVGWVELMFCIDCVIYDEKKLNRKCDAFWLPWPL